MHCECYIKDLYIITYSSQNKVDKIENEIHWKYGLNFCHLIFGWQIWNYTKPESTKSGTACILIKGQYNKYFPRKVNSIWRDLI